MGTKQLIASTGAMNRRDAACYLLAAAPAVAENIKDAHANWRRSMLERWRNAELYTVEVLDVMPETDLDYVPFEGEFTFGKHLTHLAYFNVLLLTAISRQGPLSEMNSLTTHWGEPENPKDLLRSYLRRTFQHTRELVLRLTPADLALTGIKPSEGFVSVHSGEELVSRALTHTFHHRSQAIVYLRGKGLDPPRYRF